MPVDDYKTVWGVRGDEVVPVTARRVTDGGQDGWLIKDGCFRQFVEKEKLSETREGAEARLRLLNGG